MAEKDKLRFLTGKEDNLGGKAVQRGQVYFAINSDNDSGKIYFDAPIDATTTKRILMSSDHAKTADYATAAGRAEKDSNDKRIAETYISEIKLDNAGTTILYKYPDIAAWKELKPKFLPLTGGTITGELYADSITAGSLLVNGDARFVNTILGNIETANKWKTARNFRIVDNGATNSGAWVSVDGSATNYTLQLPSTIKASLTGHASEDLALSGGTMTGNISYKGTNATSSMIRFIDNTLNKYGNGLSIGGGGPVAIGSGESSGSFTLDVNKENLYLMSDDRIEFYTYCNTIENKRGVFLDSSRYFYPDTNNTGSIGTSSNKWANMYATTFHGALSGTADRATSDIRGNAIIDTYLTNVYAKSDDSSYLYKQVGPTAERSAELIGRYTPLDSDGLINMKYIPAAALERVVTVENQTAQYALTTADVQLGDVVRINGTGQLYFVVDTNNLGNENGYLPFTASTAAKVNWSGILNRPNIVGRATGNAIVPNAANTEFTVYQVNGDGTSISYEIKPNFLPKTGGTITGELYVDGGTTLASLLVNGDARFINTIQGSISGNAATANKWTTVRNVYITDVGAAHTGAAVSVDGSKDVMLKLPSTITASLNGNADSASKLTDLTTSDQASSTDTWRRIWFARNDNVNGRPAYSDTFAYQSSTGTVKATKFQGDLVGNADSASKWKMARNFITNLGSESYASVDGSIGTYNLGVSGTLPVSHGGTGNTSFTALRAIYAETKTKLSSSGHYMSSSKLAINSTSEPVDYNLYVNGASYFSGITTHGAAVNFANNTWNLVGDDVYFGGHNVAGGFGIYGKNGNTRLDFCQYNAANTYQSIIFDGNTLYASSNFGVNGSNSAYNFYVNGTSYLNGNLTVTTAGKTKLQNTTDSNNSQDSEASLAIQGGVSVAKQLSAKTIRIDGSSSDASGSTTQGCTVNFNKTQNCIEFVFD